LFSEICLKRALQKFTKSEPDNLNKRGNEAKIDSYLTETRRNCFKYFLKLLNNDSGKLIVFILKANLFVVNENRRGKFVLELNLIFSD